jgi:spectrin beta
VQQRRKTLATLEDQVGKFGAARHFMSAELEQRFGAVQARYEALHEPLQIRRENLEDALLLHQLNRDVADEALWLEEKLPLAASAQLGASLSEVQSLQQKHLLLEADIQGWGENPGGQS